MRQSRLACSAVDMESPRCAHFLPIVLKVCGTKRGAMYALRNRLGFQSHQKSDVCSGNRASSNTCETACDSFGVSGIIEGTVESLVGAAAFAKGNCGSGNAQVFGAWNVQSNNTAAERIEKNKTLFSEIYRFSQSRSQQFLPPCKAYDTLGSAWPDACLFLPFSPETRTLL